MKLIKLWNAYEAHPNDVRVHDRLCKKIRIYASIVLKKLRVDYNLVSYEDLVQEAYICFFDIVGDYEPEKGSLDNFFLTYYKWYVIKLLDSIYEGPFFVRYAEEEIEDATPSVVDLLLAQEMDEGLNELFTGEIENMLYNEFLKHGIADHELIMKELEEEGWELDSERLRSTILNMQERITKWMKEWADSDGY